MWLCILYSSFLLCGLVFQQNLLTASLHKKMKFSIRDFFSKCDQIRSFRRIWSHLPKKSLMENLIFCVVAAQENEVFQ